MTRVATIPEEHLIFTRVWYLYLSIALGLPGVSRTHNGEGGILSKQTFGKGLGKVEENQALVLSQFFKLCDLIKNFLEGGEFRLDVWSFLQTKIYVEVLMSKTSWCFGMLGQHEIRNGAKVSRIPPVPESWDFRV